MKILISQKAPSNLNPYTAVSEKFGVQIDFKPFYLIEPLSAKEFRTQRINLADYTAITFSSRHAIDAFFTLCEEMRVKVPETMKYFCTTELVAMYLQKHIVYRKRKIFFGDGSSSSLVGLIGAKHKGENFLITTSDNGNSEHLTRLFDAAGIKYDVAVLLKSVTQDIRDIKLSDYAAVVLYNPYDVKSLLENFSDFKQDDVKFIAYGKGIVKALEEAGISIALQGPAPEVPSASKAVEIFLSQNN
ncbi:MAG: uroporphyrinogen-III synthase [Bacteroidales bacterium]|nr:uroporphyrinogen-III synthase [Bacteroidales bacterium]